MSNTSDFEVARRALPPAIALHAALMLGAFFGLSAVFEFPDILRTPVPHMLAKFRANQVAVVSCYALFTLSQIAFMAIVLLARGALRGERRSLWLDTSTGFGLVAGFAQAIGFSRWVFVVPWLAAVITDPTTPEPQRQAALMGFELLHRFAGVAVGEHLFFCCEALWALGLGLHLRRARLPFLGQGHAWVPLIAGTGVAVYAFEQYGGMFAALGPLNIVVHGALLFWLMGLGWSVWRGQPASRGVVAALTVAYALIVAPGLLP